MSGIMGRGYDKVCRSWSTRSGRFMIAAMGKLGPRVVAFAPLRELAPARHVCAARKLASARNVCAARKLASA
jgi:hypothetical protein